eukprot:m.12484 g.12484  ORF g.12484 m.12484 type:complete len:600 (+) comp5829_c0_seq1:319-2118(+)
MSGPYKRGFLKLRLSFDTSSALLVAEIESAQGLCKATNVYVKCYLMPDKKSTKQKTEPCAEKTNSPVFNDCLRWPLTNPREFRNHMLQITLWERGGIGAFIGRTSIKVQDILPPTVALEGWFELYDSDPGKKNYHILQADRTRKDAVIALYDNTPRGDGELMMKKDDVLYLISKEGQWTLVQNAVTGQEGYVPTTFLVEANSLESEPWFFGPITRAKAEKLLGNPMRKHGCFLIRESESTPGTYSLSMKDGDAVRHFRVQVVHGGKLRLQGSPSQPHDDLRALVAHHTQKRAGLTTTLKEPCPRDQPAQASDLAYAVRDKWEVPRESIELKKELGAGQYGEVYFGIWNGQTEVAVKTLKSDATKPEEFLAEAQLMKKLEHPNLVKLFAVCTIGEPIFIITELLKNGSLLDYLGTDQGGQLRLPTLIDMATDIACGMSYLEQKSFIHRDLAARNILVGDNNTCKVADFGLARVIEGSEYQPDNLEKFPVRWTAPEAMHKNIYSIKSDVWSFGVLLSEIVTYGKKPYLGLSNKEVVAKLDSGFRMKCPQGCPDSLYQIMLDCWKGEPSERPSFEVLMFRLEDFFHGKMEYTEASKVMEEED